MFEDNYPEGLKRLFVIKGDLIFLPHNNAHHPPKKKQKKNFVSYLTYCFPAAPKLFPVAYNLVKHFLSENTRQKIHILGGELLKNLFCCVTLSNKKTNTKITCVLCLFSSKLAGGFTEAR